MYLKIFLSTFRQTIVNKFLLKNNDLHSIKSSLEFAYSKKYWQYLYLILKVSHFLSSCLF